MSDFLRHLAFGNVMLTKKKKTIPFDRVSESYNSLIIFSHLKMRKKYKNPLVTAQHDTIFLMCSDNPIVMRPDLFFRERRTLR